MKKIFILLFFIFCLLPCLAQEEDESAPLDEDEISLDEGEIKTPEQKKSNYRLRASVSPKKEQQRTKAWAFKKLEKDKQIFKNRVNTEIKLLHGESEVLDYHP